MTEPLYDDILLFSVDATGRATEVTARGFEFTDDIAPLFENTKVLKPVPVMVEGEYHVFDQGTGKWKRVNITADDINQYLANTPRDVAINYEHKREGHAKGWLRLKDTARVGMLQTRTGLKTALFAAMEVFEGAANDIRKGIFRDVSIELKPVSREILGTALTGYPIMRDVQFYSHDVTTGTAGAGDAQGEHGSVASPDPSRLENDATTRTPSDDQADTPVILASNPDTDSSNPPPLKEQETPMTDQDKQAILTEALQEFGLKPEDLGALKGALAMVQRQEQELKFAHALEHVKQVAQGDDGTHKLAPAALASAAQLYAFCQEHETVNFSVNDQTLTPAQLFDELMRNVHGVQLFGAIQADPSGAAVADTIQDPPSVDPEEVLADKATVGSLVSRMKSNMKAQGLI